MLAPAKRRREAPTRRFDPHQFAHRTDSKETIAARYPVGAPVEMEAEGLMAAFQDLADNITKGARVRCVFECGAPVLMHDDAAATHLYRIAQEAVRNAIQHGKPKRIG